MLGIPLHQKGSCGLRPHMVLLKFCSSVHVVTKQCEPDQHGGDASSDISILLMKLGRNIHTTSWPTQLTEVFIQSKGHPPVPLCRGQVSSLQQWWFVTPCVISWASWALQPRSSPTSLLLQGSVVSLCTWVEFEAHLRSCWPITVGLHDLITHKVQTVWKDKAFLKISSNFMHKI